MTSSNQAIRIPVTNPGVTNDYFVLEHRRNITHYEIIDPSSCPDTGVDEGLLISYMRAGSSGPDIRPADNVVTNLGTALNPIRDGDASDLFPNGGITKITPYTTPSTADRNGNRTGLAILNIQYSGAGNEKVKFDIRQNYWEGPITTNTTWSGQVYVGENITVNSGVTLTISAGTTVLFAAGKKLIINGSIQGNGASGTPITFDRSGASGTWAGIWIENSTSSSNLNYCTLRHSTYGLRIKNSSGMVTIDHATLTDNSFGLLAENSSPFTIQNSTIQDNAYGVYIVSSSGSGSMKILSNNISSNSNHGVYLYNNADAFLGFNTITGNTQHGIYCYSNSDATIRSILPSPDYGGNIIHSNGGDGVRTAGTSYPSLGVDFQQGGIKDYYGYNEIQDNGGNEVGNFNASGTIMAERNYWSSNHEVEAEPEDLNGSVDYDPVLPEIPTMPSQQPFNTLTKTLIDFKEAYALENRDELQAAAELYLKLLHENPETDNVGFGVSGLIRCYKGQGRHAEINRLMDDLIDDFKGTALAGSASSHSLPFLVQIGDFGIAISRATELLQKNRESAADEAHYLFQLGSIYHLKSGNANATDLTNALGYYEELLQKHPDSDFALLATLEKEQLNRDGLARPAIGLSRPLVPASSFTLYPNYPNPFNPETRIGFHLDNERHVSLRVYEVSGRLVKTLADGVFPAGDHEMTWKGQDARGVAMASGVYFLELVAGNERQMRKMTVVR